MIRARGGGVTASTIPAGGLAAPGVVFSDGSFLKVDATNFFYVEATKTLTLSANAFISSVGAGILSEKYGAGAAVTGDECLAVGPLSSAALLSFAGGVRANASGLGTFAMGTDSISSGISSFAQGINASSSANNSLAQGNNAISSHANSVMLNSVSTATNQFSVGGCNNWFVGVPTQTTAVAAKTFQITARTGTNVAGGNFTIRMGGPGTGAGTIGVGIIQSPIVAAAGTTAHTFGDRITFQAGEVVVNENALSHDFRIECASDANCFKLTSATSSVQIGSATQINSAKFGVAGKFTCTDEAEIDGDLNHDGTNIGFFAVAPVARASAYTQTYATATKTVANLTSATLTDSSTGTPSTTIVDVGVVPTQASINDNFASVTAQINALRVDLENAKQVGNAVIDDNQAYGLAQ